MKMQNYTCAELEATRDALINVGDEEAAGIVQGILDTREADEYAKDQDKGHTDDDSLTLT